MMNAKPSSAAAERADAILPSPEKLQLMWRRILAEHFSTNY
jgi:hypothetical protein